MSQLLDVNQSAVPQTMYKTWTEHNK